MWFTELYQLEFALQFVQGLHFEMKVFNAKI